MEHAEGKCSISIVVSPRFSIPDFCLIALEQNLNWKPGNEAGFKAISYAVNDVV